MQVRRFACNTILLLGLSGTIFAIGCHDVAQKEICGTNVTFIPNLSTRGPGTVVTEELFQWKYCDVYAIDRGQWYHSNTPMTTTCPDMYMCGTKFPIWLEGEQQSENEGVVNLTACLRDFDTCCLRTYSISAVNCGKTMAYCFNELPSGCHQRYCFDESSTTPFKELASGTTPITTSDETQTSQKMYSPAPEETDQHTTDGPLKTTLTSEHSTNPMHILTKPTPKGNVQISDHNDTNTITILMACIGLLLVTVIGLLVAFFLRRRVKPSKISDTQAKQPSYDDDAIKTLQGLMPNDLKLDPNSGYETLTSSITLDYASLDKVYLESVDRSTKIGHLEEFSGAGLYALNQMLEWSSAELKEHGSPRMMDEDEHYQTLP